MENLKIANGDEGNRETLCPGKDVGIQQDIFEELKENYDDIEKKVWWQKTKKNGKYGVIFNGKVICDCVYDEIYDDMSGRPFLKVRQCDKYGLINIEGKIVFDLEFDDIKFFNKEGYIGVKKDDKRGLRHTTQPYKTECIYDEISIPHGSDYFYILFDGKKGALNEKGEEIINPQFQDVYICSIPNIIEAKKSKDGKSAIFDGKGNQISDFVYDRIGLNPMEGTKEKLLIMKKGSYKGIINKDGEFLPAEYEDIGEKWSEGLLPLKKGGKWGVINEKGEKIVDFIYDRIAPFLGGLSVVELNGKKGLINNIGEVILEPKLYKVRNFGEGIAGINENMETWFINNKGEKLKKIEYDYACEFKEGLLAVQQGGRWGFVDKDLNQICDLKYESVGDFRDERAIVKKGNKWGFIDKRGKEICDIRYEHLRPFIDGRAVIIRDGKYGVINKEGDEIYFGLEGYIWDFNSGLAAATSQYEKFFFIDKDGKEIGKDRGYSYTITINGVAIAHKNGQAILLNEKGEEIDIGWAIKREWLEAGLESMCDLEK